MRIEFEPLVSSKIDDDAEKSNATVKEQHLRGQLSCVQVFRLVPISASEVGQKHI